MARTTNSDTLPFVDSRYELGMLASQRVRDLNGGAAPMVDKKNDKLTVVALREIAASGDELVPNLRHEFVQSYKETPTPASDEDALAAVENSELRELDAELGSAVVTSDPVAELDAELTGDTDAE